jgi:REP element-mobilizing transposase RayT
MEPWFGNISDGKMILSETGQIANKMWFEIPNHFSFVLLDEFVVMPNHIHGIIIIKPPIVEMSRPIVGALHATSLQQRQQRQQIKNGILSSISPKPGSLASVIRSYKSAVSKNAHLTKHGFTWQSRYYDHIIRSDGELNRIRKYIMNNPQNWKNNEHNLFR